MPHDRLILRRTFLLGTALAVARAQFGSKTTSLGLLAYVGTEALWLRELPDGPPRMLANGQGISNPRFSPSGQWVSFQQSHLVNIISTDGKLRKQWNADAANWISGRDELALSLYEYDVGETDIYTAADNWSNSQRSIASSDVMIDEPHNQYAYTSSTPHGFLNGVQQFQNTLILDSLDHSTLANTVDQTGGSFTIAGFTPDGDWLIYWKSLERSASIVADGLQLYVVRTRGEEPREPGVGTLVHPDMVSFSPKNLIAVASGGFRESWTSKRIAIIDLSNGTPILTKVTGPDASALTPDWSPDGERLAWSAGPDADVLYKQQLLVRGQQTIKGPRGEVPITPQMDLGAPEDVFRHCVNLRRIWVAEIRTGGGLRQLTNDPKYFDEEPRWSRDGSHILFGRTLATQDDVAERTIWLMRDDGSEPHQVAGQLTGGHHAYYGYTDWRSLFDWSQWT